MANFIIFQGDNIVASASNIEDATKEFNKLPKPKDGRPSTKRAIYKSIKED